MGREGKVGIKGDSKDFDGFLKGKEFVVKEYLRMGFGFCRISRSYRVYRSVRQLNLDSRVLSISSRTGISVLNTGFDVNSSFVSFRPGLRVVKLNYILFR